MGKNVKARGPPEQWLASVDKRLAEQLRRKTKYTVGIFSELTSNGNRATSSLERTDPDTLPVQVGFWTCHRRRHRHLIVANSVPLALPRSEHFTCG